MNMDVSGQSAMFCMMDQGHGMEGDPNRNPGAGVQIGHPMAHGMGHQMGHPMGHPMGHMEQVEIQGPHGTDKSGWVKMEGQGHPGDDLNNPNMIPANAWAGNSYTQYDTDHRNQCAPDPSQTNAINTQASMQNNADSVQTSMQTSMQTSAVQTSAVNTHTSVAGADCETLASVFNIWGISPDTLAHADPLPPAYTHGNFEDAAAGATTLSTTDSTMLSIGSGTQTIEIGGLDPFPSGSRGGSKYKGGAGAGTGSSTSGSAGPRPYVCKECGATFAWSKNLSRHMRKHTGHRPYACQECEATFTQNSHLKVHMLKHSGLKPYACGECGAAFTRSYHLDRHQLTKHLHRHLPRSGSKQSKISAAAARKEANSGQKLSHDQNIPPKGAMGGVAAANASQPYGKGRGRKASRSNNQGQRALVGGENTGNFDVEVKKEPMGESVASPLTSVGNRPKVSQDPRKPYSCSQCDAAFRWPSTLNRHVLKHTGQRPHRCAECGAAFTQTNHLDRHMRIHTGERPYACQYCNARFRRSSHLKKHEIKHLPGNELAGMVPASTNPDTSTTGTTTPFSDSHNIQAGRVEVKAERRESPAWTHMEPIPGPSGQSPMPQPHAPLPTTGNLTQLSPLDEKFVEAVLRDGVDFGDRSLPAVTVATTSNINVVQTPTTVSTEAGSTKLKLYSCSECDSVFPWPSSLTRHMLKHTGEKPYKCALCGAAFTQVNHLNRHMLKHTGQRPYSCGQCDATFTRAGRLKTHTLRHSRKKPYPCPHCDARFRLPSNLKRHMSKHAAQNSAENTVPTSANAAVPGPSQDPQCMVKFEPPAGNNDPSFMTPTSQADAMLPLTSKAGGPGDTDTAKSSTKGSKPFPCSECDAVFQWQSSLNRHMLKHTGQRPYVCGTCDARFTQASHLDRHMRQHTGERPYGCDQCGATFTRANRLTEHVMKHNVAEEKTFPCKLCDTKFPQAVLLQRHMLTHVGHSFDVCHICNAVFTNATHLANHMVKHKGHHLYTAAMGKQVTYGNTGNQMTYNTSKQVQVQYNTGGQMAYNPVGKQGAYNATDNAAAANNKPQYDITLTQLDNVRNPNTLSAPGEQRLHICDVCQAAFTDSTHLKNHMSKHKGPKSFSCKHCGTTFTRVDNLQRHLLGHTAQRPYACQHCPATFTQANHLNNHVTKHTGLRAYQCQQCHASFRRSDHLNRHMYIHTQERPYACDQCGATFKQSSHLNKHVAKHASNIAGALAGGGSAIARSQPAN